MTKQVEDTLTAELPLARRPGRPAKYKSAAERQAAFRERRKSTGDSVDSRTVLRSENESLRNEIEQLKMDLLTSREMEANTRQVANDAYAKLTKADIGAADRKLYAVERKLKDAQNELEGLKTKRGNHLRDLLSQNFVMPKRDIAAVFLAGHNGKMLEKGYEFEWATKDALEFGRKAAIAGSSIDEAIRKLMPRNQVTMDEIQILRAAQSILSDIHNRSTHIKEKAKRKADEVKALEMRREKAAKAVIAETFPAIDLIQTTGFLGKNHNYHAEALRKLRPASITVHDAEYHTELLDRDLRSALVSRVVEAQEQGREAAEAAQELREQYLAALPGIEAERKAEIDNLNACLVAARLLAANAKTNA
jgi:hypothetical protein